MNKDITSILLVGGGLLAGAFLMRNLSPKPPEKTPTAPIQPIITSAQVIPPVITQQPVILTPPAHYDVIVEAPTYPTNSSINPYEGLIDIPSKKEYVITEPTVTAPVIPIEKTESLAELVQRQKEESLPAQALTPEGKVKPPYIFKPTKEQTQEFFEKLKEPLSPFRLFGT